ncbi:hypothetical protein ACJQWK_06755 [Exserohilum turcicum]
MELKNIAVLGPGGNVGTAILNELLKDSSSPPFTITLITRQTSSYTLPANLTATNNNNTVTHKTADYTSSASLESAFHNQDAIVNCVTGSATQYDASRLMIDAAIAAGVKLFFTNEFVGDIASPRYQRMPEAFVGAKVRIRRDLEMLASEGKISWTSLNGGPFFDMWLMKGPAGISVRDAHACIYGTGNTPLYWTPLPTIARAAAAMLRDPLPIMNRAIHICPFVAERGAQSCLTQRTLIRTLEAKLGKQFSVENVDVERINNNALAVLEKYDKDLPGGKENIGLAIKGLGIGNQFYDEEKDGCHGDNFSRLVENEVVGVKTMGVEDAVKDAIEQYGRDCAVVEGMFRVDACEV